MGSGCPENAKVAFMLGRQMKSTNDVLAISARVLNGPWFHHGEGQVFN